MEDNRLAFDKIIDIFDKWRCRYSQELFDYIIETCELDKSKKCLEIGPGTGQATDFALQTGCNYTAIELGKNLAKFMKDKYAKYPNFNIVNADFETYKFPFLLVEITGLQILNCMLPFRKYMISILNRRILTLANLIMKTVQVTDWNILAKKSFMAGGSLLLMSILSIFIHILTIQLLKKSVESRSLKVSVMLS